MNHHFLRDLVVLAQNAAPGGNPAPPNPFGMLLPVAAIALIFYFLFLRPQQREQKNRQAMIANLKKNDRVVTVGGIYGVVANIRPEADEVTLKIDETTNTRLKITMSSIARLAGEESSESKSGSSQT